MATPLASGRAWVRDPDGNKVGHAGITSTYVARSVGNPDLIAYCKHPAPGKAVQIYTVGMERVAFILGTHLGLPVPTTYLEELEGEACSVQLAVPHGRTWRQIECAPMMRDNIANTDLFPLAATFDVWMANTDRRDVNFVFEPLPEGTVPGRATGSQCWLIDHGQCGLWPADKLAGRSADDIPNDETVIDGRLRREGEAAIGERMPPQYRMALKGTVGLARTALLDLIARVDDDHIDAAVDEVSDDYFTAGQAKTTKAFLKARREVLDTVLNTYW